MQPERKATDYYGGNAQHFMELQSTPPMLFNNMFAVPLPSHIGCYQQAACSHSPTATPQSPDYNKNKQLSHRIRELRHSLEHQSASEGWMTGGMPSQLSYNPAINYIKQCYNAQLAIPKISNDVERLSRLTISAQAQYQQLERMVMEQERRLNASNPSGQKKPLQQNIPMSRFNTLKQQTNVKLESQLLAPPYEVPSNSEFSKVNASYRCQYQNCSKVYASPNGLTLHIMKVHQPREEQQGETSRQQRRAKNKAKEHMASINRAQEFVEKEEEQQLREKLHKNFLYEQYMLKNPRNRLNVEQSIRESESSDYYGRELRNRETLKQQQLPQIGEPPLPPAPEPTLLHNPLHNSPFLPQEVFVVSESTVSVQVPQNFLPPSIVPTEFIEQLVPSNNFKYGKFRISSELFHELPIFDVPCGRFGLQVDEQEHKNNGVQCSRSETTGLRKSHFPQPYSS